MQIQKVNLIWEMKINTMSAREDLCGYGNTVLCSGKEQIQRFR